VRLPIRVRLTAWYVALLAAIIAALGAFVVVELRAGLVRQEDQELRNTWRRIARDYSGRGLTDFPETARALLPRGGAAQVLDPGGRLLGTVGAPPDRAILPEGPRADVLAGLTRDMTIDVGGSLERSRVFAAPVARLGQRHVLVVAESLDDVEDSVQRVLFLLLGAVPVALAATAFGGWWLARKALLPVDRMTSKAEQIGIDRLHERIASPRATDEIGRLAVTLNAMLDRIEAGVTEKQRLVADASHELRTPLAVMRAELDVSLRGDDLSRGERPVLESVREEVDRMSRTVDNLLTLAQADEGRLELLPARVALREAVEAAAGALAPLARAKDVTLEIESGGDAEVQADRQRLHQALTNFVENAIKFSPPGGTVRVTTWARGDEVGVTVRDSGPGIPREIGDQVFDRFFRVDRARGRREGGSGLGLAICREIAHAHGGRVWVDSEPGRGSAFSLGLPAHPRGAAPVRARHLQRDHGEVTLRDS